MMSEHGESSSNFLADPDAILIEEARSGNRPAFENLVHKYYRRIFFWSVRAAGDAQAAEDLTQRIFVVVYRAACRYRPGERFPAWLNTILQETTLHFLQEKNGPAFSMTGDYDAKESARILQLSAISLANPKDKLGQEVEPEPGYIVRFWAELERQTPWPEKLKKTLKPFFAPQKLAPAALALFAAVLLGQMTLSQKKIRETEEILSSLTKEEAEVIEHLDFLRQVEILEDLEFLLEVDAAWRVSAPGA